MAKKIIDKYGRNLGTGGASTLPRFPSKRTQRRIKMPQVPKRPLRFQARTLIRHELLRIDTDYFILHRRGPHRGWEGLDPLEARAVPQGAVRGTLPERIVYKSLENDFSLTPLIDFIFQSSLQGGRINLGGIVADFVFPYMMMVIQVDGPTHLETLRIHKDNEQDMVLNEMGYQVYHLTEQIIYDQYRFDSWMEKTLGWAHSGGSDSSSDYEDVPQTNGFGIDELAKQTLLLQEQFNGIIR